MMILTMVMLISGCNGDNGCIDGCSPNDPTIVHKGTFLTDHYQEAWFRANLFDCNGDGFLVYEDTNDLYYVHVWAYDQGDVGRLVECEHAVQPIPYDEYIAKHPGW